MTDASISDDSPSYLVSSFTLSDTIANNYSKALALLTELGVNPIEAVTALLRCSPRVEESVKSETGELIFVRILSY